MNQVEFESTYGRHDANKRNGTKFSLDFRPKDLAGKVCAFLPILKWLPEYSFSSFHGDLITGLTVGIMVVPQGMAYATLAEVPPVYGLYSCFFSAFVYMFFGTSRHVSVGTFAVASMMVGAVHTQLLPEKTINETMINETLQKTHEHYSNPAIDFGYDVSPLMITSTLTLGVGVFQILMGLCRLSFLTNYISDQLVSGFTTGAAVHVLMSQASKAIGVKIKSYNGPGMILKMARDLILATPKANLWTVGMTVFGISFLTIGRDCLNPWFKDKVGVPLPMELFLVVLSIIFSTSFDIHLAHNVSIVKHVPEGMPLPSLPKLDLLFYLWHHVISISIVCYIFVFSMGKIFAKKHKYKVDSNQELYALGICQIVASFFPVYPAGASLSRSSLCEMTGAKTQLHALFSSALLLVVILWMGPWLEPLPMATLACIVIVSLRSLFMQFAVLPKLWRVSAVDFFIWVIAFVATVCIDITSGLIIGIFFVIFSVVAREQWPKFMKLHSIPSRDIFRPADLYKDLCIPFFDNVLILKFEAPLHFANCAGFIERCTECFAELGTGDALPIVKPERKGSITAIAASQERERRTSQVSNGTTSTSKKGAGEGEDESNTTVGGRQHPDAEFAVAPLTHTGANKKGYVRVPSSPVHNPSSKAAANLRDITSISCDVVSVDKRQVVDRCLILECSCISHLDSMGVEALWEIFNDGCKSGVLVKFAGFTDTVLSTLERSKFFENIPKTNFYPSAKEACLSIGAESAKH